MRAKLSCSVSLNLGELAVPGGAYGVGVGKQQIETIVRNLDDLREDRSVLLLR